MNQLVIIVLLGANSVLAMNYDDANCNDSLQNNSCSDAQPVNSQDEAEEFCQKLLATLPSSTELLLEELAPETLSAPSKPICISRASKRKTSHLRCKLCRTKHSDVAELYEHNAQRHSNEKLFHCPECFHLFRQTETFAIHLRTEHNQSGKKIFKYLRMGK